MDIQSHKQVVELGLVTTRSGDTNLGRGRRESPLDAGHAHLILANLLKADVLKAGRDIRVVVQRTLDLVHKLRCQRSDTHLAARVAFLLGEDGVSGAFNGSDGVAQILAAVKEVLETRVVATRGVGRALNQMAGNQRAGEGIEIAAAPVVPPGGSSNGRRGVGHTAADDNVCSRPQCLGNSESSKVAPRSWSVSGIMK